MAKKQYLDLAGLTTYNDEIQAQLDSKANSSHNHAASNITSGTLSSDRLPTIPITKGGTGATSAAGALTNLGLTATAAELNKLDGVTATTTELNYVDGVTSNIQTQLDAKVPNTRTVNGKALSSNITLSASDVGAATSDHTHSSYVNQNAFSNVKVGSTTVAADTTTDTLEIAAGTGISVAGDATNDKVTITNSGVRSIATGGSNGTISVNTNGTSVDVAVKGLGSAAYTASTAYDAAGTAQTKADTALNSAKSYTDTKTSGLASTSSVNTSISTHNTSTSAHNDIRELITGLTNRLNALADSDDTTLDQMSEVVAYIKANKTLIDSVTTNKVNVSDIINNLTTNVTNKPLSAAQGVAIKTLIDALQSDLDDHTHSGSDITSGTVAAARLPVASDSAAGIVNTDTQSFKGAKTFTSSVTVAGLKTPTANTGDIGTSSMPFDGVYAKDLCIAPQVVSGSAIQAGRFTVDRAGTTTTNGITRLEIGNYIQSGKAGNAEGYLEIYNASNGSVTLRTSHEDDNNFYIELPEHSGTLLTDDDAYAKDETYSKDELEWTQIYDSGSIANKVNSVFINNISDYKKFRVAVKCVNSANSEARAGSVIFKATDGTLYQFPVWTNLFTTSAATSAGMAEFEIIDGYLVCPNATRSIKTTNFISPTEGGTADNLVSTGSGIIKCTKTISNVIISSLDQNSNFYFGVGSRVVVWGCMA